MVASLLAVGCANDDRPQDYPPHLLPGAVITGVSFDWSTHRREAPGSDNWVSTWADDGHQYSVWGDGGGFGGTNEDGRVSLGVARIEGDHNDYEGINRFGGKNPECESTIDGKSYGIISLDGTLYAWVSPGTTRQGFLGFTLYRSTDKGCHWTRRAVAFSRASHNLVHGTFLTFGQDNAGARDEYVYSYAAEIQDVSGLKIQKPGNIYLMRVPASAIEDASAYEFYTATDPTNPTWSTDASARAPVFHDPDGVSWNTGSVVHLPGLDQYVLTTEHTASGRGNIQMHVAPEPWGPWTEILRESDWGRVEASTFYWTFAPKWFRDGGLEFTLIFTGFRENDSWNTVDGRFEVSLP